MKVNPYGLPIPGPPPTLTEKYERGLIDFETYVDELKIKVHDYLERRGHRL